MKEMVTAMSGLRSSSFRNLTSHDVRYIPAAHTPMVILSDNMQSWVSRRIVFWSTLRKGHRENQFSHAMFLLDPSTVASQGTLYRTQPLDDWIADHLLLKFWCCVDWTPYDRELLRRHIQRELSMKWYRRVYDVVGLGGQWLQAVFGWGAWLNAPGIHFCSARTAGPIKRWAPGLSTQPSPADMDKYFADSPNWRCYGIYNPRQGLDA